MIMSDLTITSLPLTAITEQRSAFKPMRAPGTRRAGPTQTVDEYARGLADGEQIAAAAFEVDRQALLNLLAATQALKPEAGPELATLLRETVIGLVAQISDAITIDTAFLEAQITCAIAIISEADEARQIILHPDDAVLVGDHLNSLIVQSDPRQPRGMVRIDCSQGWVEHGVAIGIERLRNLLGVTV